MSDTPQYIVDFIKAICPDAPELYMASFNEEYAIIDATSRINSLETDNTELEAKLADRELRLEEQRQYAKRVEGSHDNLKAINTDLKAKLAAAERENIKLRGQIVLLETDLKTLRHIRKGYTPEGK